MRKNEPIIVSLCSQRAHLLLLKLKEKSFLKRKEEFGTTHLLNCRTRSLALSLNEFPYFFAESTALVSSRSKKLLELKHVIHYYICFPYNILLCSRFPFKTLFVLMDFYARRSFSLIGYPLNHLEFF